MHPKAFPEISHDPRGINVNEAPVLAAPLVDQSAFEDAPFSFMVPVDTFVVPDIVVQLTHSATLAGGRPLPAWLGFDPATRTFSGTPQQSDVGTLEVRVTATDTVGDSISDIFTLAIGDTNDAPTIAGGDTALVSVGENASAATNIAATDVGLA